eukprot:TRINITY_DN96246_c0_g1_i1.p2 TRINITY_DN96246_c0_g1~~TRINITY_DN96246_c0_g1_i1.p2  ORF type:complete len:167 (+),score=91.59 TRINITY_DN96246_c0_g1_i1:59-559(+)
MPKSAKKKRGGSAKTKESEEEKLEKERKKRERAAMLRVMTEESDELYEVAAQLQEDGDLEGARKTFKKAVDTYDEHVPALFSLALLYEREHRMKDAAEMYRRAAEAANNSSNPDYRAMHPRIAGFASSIHVANDNRHGSHAALAEQQLQRDDEVDRKVNEAEAKEQ